MANFKNGAIATILTPPSGTSGTSTVVNSGQGANYSATFPFYATAYPPGVIPMPSNWEIVRVDARSTDTLTIVRAQKGSTARTWSAGWILANAVYDDDLFTSSLSAPEVLGGTPNNSTTAFTLSQVYTMVNIFKNGRLMREGAGNDYTISGTTVTFTSAPLTGDTLMAQGITGSQLMISGSNSQIFDETPSGAVNSSNTSFTTANPYVPGTLRVFVGGDKQKRGVHFTETSPGTGGFTMSDAPWSGDDMMVDYQFVQSVTGNADTVDGINANTTATANNLMPLDANAKFPLTLISSPARVRVQRGTTQSLANNTWVKIQLNTEVYDTGNNFDNATNYRFTAPVTGDYFIRFTGFMAGALMQTAVDCYVNGVGQGVVYQDNRQQTTNSPQWVDVLYLTAGDYVEMYMWHLFGSPASMVGASATFRYLGVG